jgi:hypothetical protein
MGLQPECMGLQGVAASPIARTGECENCHIASARDRVVKACSPPESDLTLVVACALLSCVAVIAWCVANPNHGASRIAWRRAHR